MTSLTSSWIDASVTPSGSWRLSW
jgi:hypothetical protein